MRSLTPSTLGLATLLGAALFLALMPSSAPASAPPPLVKGSFSAHRRSLVIVSYQYGPSVDACGGHEIRSVTYEVLAPFTPLPRHALHAPVTLLSSPWSVTPPDRSLRWPMITDDGTTLLLLDVTTVGPERRLISIYRHTGYGSTLVHTLSAADLWTQHEANPSGSDRWIIFDDYQPLWFAIGALRFTDDDQDLLYTSPDRHKLRIHLADGTITRLH